MTCDICGRGACSRMCHSLEEQAIYDSVAGLSEFQLRTEVIDLKAQCDQMRPDFERYQWLCSASNDCGFTVRVYADVGGRRIMLDGSDISEAIDNARSKVSKVSKVSD